MGREQPCHSSADLQRRWRFRRPTAAPPRTFRLLTLNVHGWHNEESQSWSSLVTLLHEKHPDVIGLQEATKHRVPALAQALGNFLYWLFRGNCALLSRHPLIPSGPSHTAGRGKTQQGRSVAKSEEKADCRTRHCMARVRPADGSELEVHLDHVREPNRLSELAKLVEYMRTLTTHEVTHRVWMGDFNALTQSDYPPEQWARIADVRARSAWEPPASELTAAMTRAPTKKAPLGLRMVDAWDAASASERAAGPLGTSRYDTRIDYIYLYGARRRGQVGPLRARPVHPAHVRPQYGHRDTRAVTRGARTGLRG